MLLPRLMGCWVSGKVGPRLRDVCLARMPRKLGWRGGRRLLRLLLCMLRLELPQRLQVNFVVLAAAKVFNVPHPHPLPCCACYGMLRLLLRLPGHAVLLVGRCICGVGRRHGGRGKSSRLGVWGQGVAGPCELLAPKPACWW